LSKTERNAEDIRSGQYSWEVSVTALAPVAELTVTAQLGDRVGGSSSGKLPVELGMMWVAPEPVAKGKLAIRSPSPRRWAFVSLLSVHGRFWGAQIPMKTDDQGFGRGEIALPAPLPSGALMAVISSDSSESEGATIGWPLRPSASGRMAFRPVKLLADGLPAAIEREEQRYRAARLPGYGIIVLAGLLEVFFLWLRHRRAGAKLEAHLRAAAAETDESPGAKAEIDVAKVAENVPLIWLLLVAGAVTLAFATLAAIAAWGV